MPVPTILFIHWARQDRQALTSDLNRIKNIRSMFKKNNRGLSICLSLSALVFVVMPFISSCGKSSTNASSLNIQYQIVNLNSGIGSVDLYVHYVKVNSSSNFYPSSSGYFYLPSINMPFQVRRGTSLT